MEMVASSKKIEPQKLPPTPRAAYFYSLHVHHQIMIWKNLSVDIDPTKWGWKLDGKSLQPIITDLEPAPEFIIKFIRCKCKLSARSPCSSNVCSCRKHGLKCVSACGDCHGQNCQNSEVFFEYTDEKLYCMLFQNFQYVQLQLLFSIYWFTGVANANY